MKTVMKKMFSLLLVAVLLVSAVPTAFADEAPATYTVTVQITGSATAGSTVQAKTDGSETVGGIYAWVANKHGIDTNAYDATYSWAGTVYSGSVDSHTAIGESGTLTVSLVCKHANPVVDAAVAPTCTKAGLTEGKHCSVCNYVIVAQTAVAATGHTEVTDAAVAPTCTQTGLTEGKHCAVCNEVLVAQNVVAALGHTWNSASCTQPKTCSVCNAVDGNENGHIWILQSEVAPTCTTAGKKEYKCGVTGCTATKNEDIPALGHSIGSDGKCLREGCAYAETTRYALDFYLDYNENNSPVSKLAVKGSKIYGIYTPSRPSYAFEGWYTASGVRVPEDAIVSGDAAYYAKWTQMAPHEVFVKFYTHGNTKTPVKYVDMHHYAHDGVITLEDLEDAAYEHFEGRGNGALYVQGPFTSSEWDIFSENSAYRNTREKIEVSQTSTTVIHAMVRNVDDTAGSNSSYKADSSNPKTGDMIFTPAIVMGASVSALAVLFYLNKKRSVI